MEKEFVTYEIALAFKELCFDEECFGFYKTTLSNNEPELCIIKCNYNSGRFITIPEDFYTDAPLWQQVIDWFRKKHNIHIEITCANFFDSYMNSYSYGARCKVYKDKELKGTAIVRDDKNNHIFYSYEQAREQAILKTIELVKDKQYGTKSNSIS